MPIESTQGWVYFITWSVDAPVKIGFSVDPDQRLGMLQTANPYRLYVEGVLRGTMADERGLHAQFRGSRLEGEWFRRGPKLNALIAGAEKSWHLIVDGEYDICSPIWRQVTDVGSAIGHLFEVVDEDGERYFRSKNRKAAEVFCEMCRGKSKGEARRGVRALEARGLLRS